MKYRPGVASSISRVRQETDIRYHRRALVLPCNGGWGHWEQMWEKMKRAVPGRRSHFIACRNVQAGLLNSENAKFSNFISLLSAVLYSAVLLTLRLQTEQLVFKLRLPVMRKTVLSRATVKKDVSPLPCSKLANKH